jgi:hypothetical protein
MLDTMKLSEGKVEIVGVFTVYEQDRGLAYGAAVRSSSKDRSPSVPFRR